MKVFLIDKNEFIVEFLKESFEARGAEVIVFEHSKDITKQISQSYPDIILSGYFLNSFNSIEILQYVKNNLPQTKFYSMSSYPFLDVDKILEMGADGFFQKSDGLDQIVEKIILTA